MNYVVIGINDSPETVPRYVGHNILDAALAFHVGCVHGNGRCHEDALVMAESARVKILAARKKAKSK
jgi:hypothetical protein